MSKEDSIEVTGTVVEKFPSGQFAVQLDQDRTVRGANLANIYQDATLTAVAYREAVRAVLGRAPDPPIHAP